MHESLKQDTTNCKVSICNRTDLLTEEGFINTKEDFDEKCKCDCVAMATCKLVYDLLIHRKYKEAEAAFLSSNK